MRLPAFSRTLALLLAALLAACSTAPTTSTPEAPPVEIPAEPEVPPAAPLAGSSWTAERILDKPAGMADSILEFPEEGLVSGNTGCNNFNGTVRIAEQSIEFGPLATTRRMCAPAVNGQETVFLEALELTVGWRKVANMLELLDAEGTIIMLLIRN